jgi:hypothetical protein
MAADDKQGFLTTEEPAQVLLPVATHAGRLPRRRDGPPLLQTRSRPARKVVYKLADLMAWVQETNKQAELARWRAAAALDGSA